MQIQLITLTMEDGEEVKGLILSNDQADFMRMLSLECSEPVEIDAITPLSVALYHLENMEIENERTH